MKKHNIRVGELSNCGLHMTFQQIRAAPISLRLKTRMNLLRATDKLTHTAGENVLCCRAFFVTSSFESRQHSIRLTPFYTRPDTFPVPEAEPCSQASKPVRFSMETILHAYQPKRTLLLLEYVNRSGKEDASRKLSSPPNVLLFVGGLYDNFRWPRYLDDLAALFPRDVPDQQWRVMQVQLSSNGRSWGISDLDRDVSRIELLLRRKVSITSHQTTGDSG
ncbi:hypothetical protein CLCR_01710 [Cladophialophora carrionii]|uniref:Uncharacterized protein n=1 Tax=Cladophialophora carrionii TaxID=86049 RepID=A0A1C1CB49_9EURO|nr:hypothetical protein CLCR_01710 [Cladophialophora carrionii]